MNILQRSMESNPSRLIMTGAALALVLSACSSGEVSPSGSTSTRGMVPEAPTTTKGPKITPPPTIRCFLITQAGCEGLTDTSCPAPAGESPNVIMGRDSEGKCVPTSYGTTNP